MSFDAPTVLWIAIAHDVIPYQDRAAFVAEIERLGPDSPRLQEIARVLRVHLPSKCCRCEERVCVCEFIGGRE